MKTINLLIDMDGVLVKGQTLIPGADRFIETLITRKIKFLLLTNNSIFTPGDLSHRLQHIGLKIAQEQIFTSAMSTAHFLNSQSPNGTAFVIGESGLTEAVHGVGFVLTETNPDYVVLGETNGYNFDRVTHAIRHVMKGAHFIATNPDPNGPTDKGIVPACGSMAALIEKASGKSPFFAGKPNPYMMRAALNYLGVHSENTIMIGDRMDTDIIAGIESGMDTILVLSGVTKRDEIPNYPYKPKYIYESVIDIDVDKFL